MENRFKTRFIVQHLIGMLAWLVFNILLSAKSPWVTPEHDFPHVMNILWTLVVLGSTITWAIFVFNKDWEPFGDKDEEFYEKWSLGKPRGWMFWLLLIVILFYGSKFAFKLAGVYNKSVVYYKQYDKAVEGKRGFYDKMWKTYIQKEKITNLNKEMFLEVTKTIMENRKDGESVAWKWVHENQQIPYEEFTSFYKDLSNFIESKRDEYYRMEMYAQDVVNAHNMLIDTFPNNIYNKVLGRKALVFSYGFLSDSTRKVFSSGNEDVK